MLLSILLAALCLAAETPEKHTIIAVDVTDAETVANQVAATLTLKIQADGNVNIDGIEVGERELLDRLVKLPAETAIVIDADPATPFEAISTTMTWVESAGLNNISFLTKGGRSAFDPLFSTSNESTAEDLNAFEAKDLRAVKPKHWKFPQNPYGNTDYTAYSLELGEIKVGLGSVTMGVLPRIQLGTYPILDALGVQNLSLKGNIIREGRLDAAGVMSVWWIPTGSVLNRYKFLNLPQEALDSADYIKHAFYTSIGLRGSLRISEPWSAHVGASYIFASLAGNFDIDTLPDLLLPIADQASGEFGLAPHLDGNMLMINFATDVRFNRRDSIVLMGRFVPFAKARVGVNVDEWVGVESGVGDINLDGDLDFSVAYGGVTNPLNSYAISLAWQFSWKHIEARFGYGISAVPYTWVIGPFDMSYRFGGKTRRTQTKIKKGWKDNRKDFRQDSLTPAEEAPAEEAPAEEAPAEEAPAEEAPAEEAPAEEQ